MRARVKPRGEGSGILALSSPDSRQDLSRVPRARQGATKRDTFELKMFLFAYYCSDRARRGRIGVPLNDLKEMR
jgi:hypothetical protein